MARGGADALKSCLDEAARKGAEKTEKKKARFSLTNLYLAVLDALPRVPELEKRYKKLLEMLKNKRLADYVMQSIVRHTFLIEIVHRPKIETTRFATRWSEDLTKDWRDPKRVADPRRASFEDCYGLCLDVLDGLLEHLAKDGAPAVELLKLFQETNQLAYEIPLD